MAPATSSRRKTHTRRQASSDIEEGQPSQREARDDVMDEDEDGPPRRSTVKKEKEKKPTKKQERAPVPDAEDVGDGAEEDDDDEVIDVDNFANQPLLKQDLTKLTGLSSDWEGISKKIRQGWDAVEQVAISFADVGEGEEAQKGVTQLDLIMKDLLDIESEMQFHSQSINDIHQKIALGEKIDDANDRYNVGVDVRLEEYKKKTTRQKYAKSDAYKKFKEGVYEVNHPGEAMPPVTEFIPKEDGDGSDSDDELEIGGVTQDYKCPITLRPLEDSLTSEICGHSFSKKAITQTFNGSKGEKACPASGCNKSFKLSDCKPNKSLDRKVKAAERRARRQEEEMEAEEVIE